MAVEIRRLGPGDEEVVRRLSIEDARTPHTLESAREFLAVETNYQLAAFDDDEPVGQLLAYELIRRHGDGRMMFIYEVGVRGDHRRRGVGRGLFDLLRALCRQRGISRVFLITNESNFGALAFYESLGAGRDHDDDVLLALDWSQ